MIEMVDRDDDLYPTPVPDVRTGSDRAAIVVLGMHRAGTSALAGVLHMLGADPPKHLQAATEFNVKGNWESRKIMRLNDRILHAGGSNWKDWTAFDEDRIASEARSEFDAEIADVIAAEFGEARLILLKDPRMCRLAPFWLRGLDRAGIVPKIAIPIRNPLECAYSLLDRDGIQVQEGLLLWLRHVLDAERITRGRRRCIVSFSELLDDWRAAADRISNALQIKWPIPPSTASSEIDQFLSRDLRHHQNSFQDTECRADVIDWAPAAYDAMMKLNASAEPAKQCLNQIDAIYREFDLASRVFGAAVQQKNMEIAARTSEAQAATEELETYRRQSSNDLIRTRIALYKANEENRRLHNSVPWRVLASVRKLWDALARFPRGGVKTRNRSEAEYAELIMASGLFDPAWYLEAYDDVRESGIDPVIHYLRYGAAEGRNPSKLFSAIAYKRRYRDMAAGVNPLVHFVECGIDNGRQFEPVSAPMQSQKTGVPRAVRGKRMRSPNVD